ncbi:HAD-IC family P-type ATPase [Janthinobacterium sp. 17J80-10]|uniref:cation-translocating P-type ATPase n=1 Tax=Janthinobacterium sp. 17J80-10 TaxID=2497863 RepID=UPI0010054F53|nr:HAD-IC family P-type ATPase [Janthinobacterium sp. 17J80-10]QAU33328.1 HAD family hydrolase [Janthinobacterium sp. 17J80-10]
MQKPVISAGQPDISWHAVPAEQALQHLQADAAQGLAHAEASRRSAVHGPNQLAQQPPPAPWKLFLDQFKSILIIVLIIAAGLAAAIGSTKDAMVILAVVVFNALVGFYQEYRAEASLAALKKMLPAKARVRRAGDTHEVAADDLVPGDIVLLEAGDRVPADGRLLQAIQLAADESALTGESQPGEKQAGLLDAGAESLGDRHNMLYMNTMVTRGRAELLVTAIGTNTEMGRISEQLAQTPDGPSPLQLQLDQLGKRLGAVALTLVGLLFFVELLRGARLEKVVLDAIALAVAAIPEGLPVVVTVALAIGMHKMARQRAIVKRLSGVETLGCTTVICSDKTGTLTMNQMTARAIYCAGARFAVSGEGYGPHGEIRPIGDTAAEASTETLAPLLMAAVACNDSRIDAGRLIGDPTEGALLALAQKGGIEQNAVTNRLPRIAEIPFDSAHKFMATFHDDDGQALGFFKGAPDVLLARCSHYHASGGAVMLDAERIAAIKAENRAMAAGGLRIILIAERRFALADLDGDLDMSACASELTFIGLVGLMDPPRPEARDAIASCRAAGIEVKMITGDHRDTAQAIAADLGLRGGAISGAELDALDAAQLADRIDGIAVFARVAPQHKVRIVQALKARGHVVAMTGDGVNDAPALKNADIGVAMGLGGTAVTQEAASMVLTDDNFATIVSAVHNGRALYDNIVKFVRFQLATTIGAILTIFFAPLAGLPEPFNPLQILWVAMIMDGPPAIALALDAARPGLMDEPPRDRAAPVLSLQRLVRILGFGLSMMFGTVGILYYGMATGSQTHALTLAFSTFVLFQFFNVFNARVEHGSAFNRNFFRNGMLWISLAGVLVLQAAVVHWEPAQGLFGTTSLSLADWGLAVAVASSVLLLDESRKLILRIAAMRR